MIGKRLYLYEGREEKNGRRKLTNVFYLGGLYTEVSDIDKGVRVMDKYHLMKYINKTIGQILDDVNEVKGKMWKALYKGKKKKFVKSLKEVRKCAPKEKAVDECGSIC